MLRRVLSQAALLLSTLVLLAAPGMSQIAEDWPNKPVRIVVGTAPGGGTDIVARDLASFLSQKIGQSVIVENRPGASGSIGAGLVARSPADGYTFFLNQGGAVTASLTQEKPPYNAVTDFSSVILLGRGPIVFFVTADSPFKTVDDVIKAAKEKPGSLAFGSPGIGTPGHLAAEMFQAEAGIKLRHVPFTGTAQQITNLLGQQISMSFDTIGGTSTYLKSGQFRPLMLASNTRSPLFPDIPLASEIGLKNVESYTWYAISGPAKLPRPIVDKLNAAIQDYLKSPSGVARMDESAVLPKRGSTPEELDDFIKSEIARLGPIIKTAGLKSE